jgi:hypothetical protein
MALYLSYTAFRSNDISLSVSDDIMEGGGGGGRSWRMPCCCCCCRRCLPILSISISTSSSSSRLVVVVLVQGFLYPVDISALGDVEMAAVGEPCSSSVFPVLSSSSGLWDVVSSSSPWSNNFILPPLLESLTAGGVNAGDVNGDVDDTDIPESGEGATSDGGDLILLLMLLWVFVQPRRLLDEDAFGVVTITVTTAAAAAVVDDGDDDDGLLKKLASVI